MMKGQQDDLAIHTSDKLRKIRTIEVINYRKKSE